MIHVQFVTPDEAETYPTVVLDQAPQVEDLIVLGEAGPRRVQTVVHYPFGALEVTSSAFVRVVLGDPVDHI